MKKLIFALLLFLFLCSTVFADGTVTRSRYFECFDHKGQQRCATVIKWSWTSTSGTATISGGEVTGLYGFAYQIVAVPNTTNKPDDNYDVDFLLGKTGADAFYGVGDDLPQALASDENIRTMGDWLGNRSVLLLNDSLTFSGTNMNTSGTASGDVYLYILLP